MDEFRRNGSCHFCPEDDPIVLEFHHTDPESKSFDLSNAWRHYGMQRVMDEVAKCILVCANCHKRIHAGKIEVGE